MEDSYEENPTSRKGITKYSSENLTFLIGKPYKQHL